MDATTEALFTRGTPLEQLFRHDPPIEILTNLRGKNAKVVSYFCRSATILQLFEILLAPKPSENDPPEENGGSDVETEGNGESSSTPNENGDEDGSQPSLPPPIPNHFPSPYGGMNGTYHQSVIDNWKESTLLACSILTSDVDSFLDMVVRLEFLDVLFEYLKRDRPLECVTVSSFCRVVEFLFQIRTNSMFDYTKKREQVLPGLTQHLDCDVVFKLLTFIVKLSVERDDDKPRLETLQWLSLASLLVNQLLTTEESFESELFANTVNFIIHLLDTYTMEQFAPFMLQLQNENLVRKIVEKALIRYKNPGTCVGCVRLLIKLLDSHKTGDQRAVIADQVTQLYQDYMGEMQAYTRQPPAIVFELISHSNILLSLLTTGVNPAHSNGSNGNGNGEANGRITLANGSADGSHLSLSSSGGPLFPPKLGLLRYTLVQLVAAILRTNYWVVDSFLRDSELLWTCLELFFFYQETSMLHDVVMLMMRELFLKQTHKDLSDAAVADYRLHMRIMAEFKKKESLDSEADPNPNHKDIPHFMGHLVHISNFIWECSATKRRLTVNKQWQDFVTETIRKINELHKPVKPIIRDTCVRQATRRTDDRKEPDTSVWELFDEEFW